MIMDEFVLCTIQIVHAIITANAVLDLKYPFLLLSCSLHEILNQKPNLELDTILLAVRCVVFSNLKTKDGRENEKGCVAGLIGGKKFKNCRCRFGMIVLCRNRPLLATAQTAFVQ